MKNLYDLTVENNDKINSQLYDETGMVTVPLYGAAAESAMSESEYLAATGGTSHTLYNLEAQKDLDAQVAGQRAQAGTLYELSKPTYGVKGKQLYDLGANNSGYAKYLGNANKKALKQNLYAIDEGEKAAKQEIAVNTAQLKAQNISNYAQYISKYGTVLDDYERYESENYSPAQIQQKLLKDGYTADQIGAVDRLKAERDLIPEGQAPNRDDILYALQEGTVSKEWAEGQLLSSYLPSDTAKVAEDVKNGLITEETAKAWAQSTLDTYATSGIRLPYANVDAWVKEGIIDKETADAYKRETNAIRSDLAQKAFDSPADLDRFLDAWGGSDLVDQDGNPISDGAKSAYALQKVVDLVNTGVFESNGIGNKDAIEKTFSAYTEKVKNASETDAETMLAAANAIYEDAKANGDPNLATLKDAVGEMFAADAMQSTQNSFSVGGEGGFRALGNWASAALYGNEAAGNSDFKEAHESAIKKFIEDHDISIVRVSTGGQSRNPSDYGFAYYVKYDGKTYKAGENKLLGDDQDFTKEELDALESILKGMKGERFVSTSTAAPEHAEKYFGDLYEK